jgi:hypothetical protein
MVLHEFLDGGRKNYYPKKSFGSVKGELFIGA